MAAINKEPFELGKIILLGRLPGEYYITKKGTLSKFPAYKGKYKCFCNNEFTARISDVRSGDTKSCGCFSKWNVWNNCKRIDGRTKTRLFTIYAGAKQRILNPNHHKYKIYGGRGIQMCKEWIDDFLNFKKWAESNDYNENLSLDRIDVNGNYCPENCRWIDPKNQAKNTRKRQTRSEHPSKYKGVFYEKNPKSKFKKWRSQITCNRKYYKLGIHHTEEDAAYIYNFFCKLLHKEFASLNKLPDEFIPSQCLLDLIENKIKAYYLF